MLHRRQWVSVGLAIVCAAALVGVAAPAQAGPVFVTRSGAGFDLGGQPYRFGGTNNYYLHYSSTLMVDDVFADAQAMGVKVVRAWTFLECGGDRPNSNGGCSQGTDKWMQRWSNSANAVVYNEGATGLLALDRMVASAAAHQVKLLLPFTGNWRDFGGMDQYVTWYGLPFHDQFFTDARVRQDYRNWIAKLVNRTNTVTGVAYRNDPTIFGWELANEPRCIDASLPTSGTCTADTLTNWASDMSAYVKSLDANHLVSVGDEGFHPGVGGTAGSWPYNVTDGVDHARLTALSTVDFGTYHLYPQGWGQSPTEAWGTAWINDHNAVGTSVNKPEILEEFGSTEQGTRDATYTAWTNAVRTGGGDGWMFWLLTGIQDNGQLYPDFDGFRVVVPSSTATVLANAAAAIGGPSTPDTTPPSAPGTPVASGVTSTSVTLTWAASTDNVGVTGYEVRSGTAVVATPSGTTTAVTGLTPATAYSFTVRARDAAGNWSSPSGPVPVTTLPNSAGACRVTYAPSPWTESPGVGGFTAYVTVANTGTASITGWTLRFALPAGQSLTPPGWSATWTASGQQLSATNLSWNATLGPGGGSTQIGFNGRWSGAFASPTSFTLNNAACTIG